MRSLAVCPWVFLEFCYLICDGTSTARVLFVSRRLSFLAASRSSPPLVPHRLSFLTTFLSSVHLVLCHHNLILATSRSFHNRTPDRTPNSQIIFPVQKTQIKSRFLKSNLESKEKSKGPQTGFGYLKKRKRQKFHHLF